MSVCVRTDEVIANQTFIRYMGWDEKTVLTENPTIIAYDQRVRITGILKVLSYTDGSGPVASRVRS